MQVAQAGEGEVIYDALVYEKMRMMKPDLREPQPSLPMYFGDAQEHIKNYCDMVQARHPEVEDPLNAETDEESLLLSGHGLEHGRTKFLNAAVKHTLTTTFTRLKAGLTSDSPPIPPRRRPRRPTYDVSFRHFHPLSFLPC